MWEFVDFIDTYHKNSTDNYTYQLSREHCKAYQIDIREYNFKKFIKVTIQDLHACIRQYYAPALSREELINKKCSSFIEKWMQDFINRKNKAA